MKLARQGRKKVSFHKRVALHIKMTASLVAAWSRLW